MNKLICITIIWLMGIGILSGQTNSAWLNYTSSEKVHTIKVRGNDVWIATFGGLVKYDKTTGEKIYYTKASSGLPSNHVVDLDFDQTGSLWVSTKYNGIGKFNTSTHNCVVYNQNNSGLPFDQWNYVIKIDKNNNVWVGCQRWLACFNGEIWQTWDIGNPSSSVFTINDLLIEDNGVVWVCSTDGLGKVVNGVYTSLPGILGANCIAADKDNNLWIGTAGSGLYFYNRTSFTNYNKANSSIPSNTIYSIKSGKGNELWIAASVLVKFENHEFISFTPDDHEQIMSVEPDNGDMVWCGTLKGKLLRFDGTKFTLIDVSNSPLMDNYISSIVTDADNSVWIGTRKNLVNSKQSDFISISKSDTAFNPPYVTAISSDKYGNTWIAFGAGDTTLLKISNKGSVVFNKSNSPFQSSIPFVAFINRMKTDNNGNLWLATINGLYKYDGNTFVNYNTSNSSLPANNILTLAIDSKNNVWGGTASGLFRFDGSSCKVWDKTNSSLPTDRIVSIACGSNNKIWVSCMDESRIEGDVFGGGLVCLDEEKITVYNIDNSNIKSNTIFDIYIDGSNTIWLGTCGAGLVSFDGQSVWKNYNMSNSGIAFFIVKCITKDQSGNLWLGHDMAGVSVFNPNYTDLSVNLTDEYMPLTVFPNPAGDDLFVNLGAGKKENLVIRVYDMNGRLIHTFLQQKISGNNPVLHYKLDGLLIAGQMYLLNLTWSSGQSNARFLYKM